MKLLWVNPSFLDYRVPVYRSLYELLKGDFYLVYSKSRTPPSVVAKVEQALGDHAKGLSGELRAHLGRHSDTSNSHVLLAYQPHLFSTVCSLPADVVIAEGFFQWTPAALYRHVRTRTPLVIAYERTQHTERNCPAWRTAYRRWVARHTAAFISNGILCKQYLMSMGVPESQIVTGGMAADSDYLKKAASAVSSDERLRLKHSLSATSPVFLYVGQIIQRKGLNELLLGWREYKAQGSPGTLVLVGEGVELPSLKNTVSRHQIPDVNFVGAVKYDDIARYYAMADVFIIPTLEDNWSLVVPEAMACGLPVACSKYNGCWPELVKEGQNGTVFDPLDTQDIVRALTFFFKNKTSLRSMGQLSSALEASFSPSHAAEAVLKACEHALRQHRSNHDA